MMNAQNLPTEELSKEDVHQEEQRLKMPAAGNFIVLAIIRCGGFLFGIDVKWVREVQPYTVATPVFGMPSCWLGITGLRGHLYAVLDLGQVLCPDLTPAEDHQQIVFTNVGDYAVGLLVDAVPHVQQIETASISEDSILDLAYIHGSTPDLIRILDLPTLYDDLDRSAAGRESHVKS
jgi:chemotaxis signal transduction protein